MSKVVSGMMKYRIISFLFFVSTFCFSQRSEREHQIRKSQFPSMQNDMMILGQKIRKMRFYKEIDSLESTYTIRFKAGKVSYFFDYDSYGELKISGIRIKEIDIPQKVYQKIEVYLSNSYEKYRTKRIYQLYPEANTEKVNPIKSTNSNPHSETYKFFIKGKNGKVNNEYDIWFSKDGNPIRKRTALPMNHDRILY